MKPLAPIFAIVVGVACATASMAADTNLTDAQLKGRVVFAAQCALCHGERGHATTLLAKRVGKEQAPLEKRSDLSPALVRHVVRHGINSMPWFRRAELPDIDLDAVTAYLTRPKS